VRKILPEESRFEVFDRVICRAVGKLVSDGQVSKPGGVRLIQTLMYENQAKLFGLGMGDSASARAQVEG